MPTDCAVVASREWKFRLRFQRCADSALDGPAVAARDERLRHEGYLDLANNLADGFGEVEQGRRVAAKRLAPLLHGLSASARTRPTDWTWAPFATPVLT